MLRRQPLFGWHKQAHMTVSWHAAHAPTTHLCGIRNQGCNSSTQGVPSHIHIVDLAVRFDDVLQGCSNASPNVCCDVGKALVHLTGEVDVAWLEGGWASVVVKVCRAWPAAQNT